MKETYTREPNLKEQTLTLWEELEEVEDLYLKDFPTKMPLVYSFGKVKVSVNFSCYEDCREYGIGAMSISTQEEDYSEFRKDIVIRKKSTGTVESTAREYDVNVYTNHLGEGYSFPHILPNLSQPIDYYEEILDMAKNPNITFRKLNHEDIYEATKYLDRISVLLSQIDHEKNHQHP